MTEVLNRYSNRHPALAALLNGVVLRAPSPIDDTQITAWFGVHSEAADASFTYSADTVARILIELNNGIDINFTFNTPEMGASFDAQGQLDNYRLRISSNNRTIATPSAAELDVSLDINILETPIGFAAPVANGLASIGTIEYTNAANTKKSYQIDFALGLGDSIAQSTQVTQGQHLFVRDQLSQAPGSEWLFIDTMEFELVDSDWLVGQLRQTYQDAVLQYEGLINGNLQSYVTSKEVTYSPSGTFLFTIDTGTLEVASQTGGPYICNYANPLKPVGIGNLISLLWGDLTYVPLLPTNDISCADLRLP